MVSVLGVGALIVVGAPAGLMAPIASAAPAAVAPTRLSATENFVGADTVGPYYLTRTGVMSGDETVQLDNLPQVPALDYTLDPVAGSLIFTRPVSQGHLVRIQYFYDPATSREANRAIVNNPLDVGLLAKGGGSVQLLGNYESGAPGHAATTGLSNLGVALNENLQKRGSLSARFLLSPASGLVGAGGSSSPAAIGGSGGQTQLNGLFNIGTLKLGAGYDSIGKDFAPQGKAAAGAPKATTDLSLVGPLTQKISLDVGVTRQDQSSSPVSSNDHVKVGISTSGGTVVLSRQETAVGSGTGANTTEDTDVSLNHIALGHTKGAVLLSADLQRKSGSAGGTDRSQEIGSVGLSMSPRAGMTIGVGETRSDGTAGPASATHDVSFQMGQVVQAKASLTQIAADGGSNRSVDLKLDPMKGLEVTSSDKASLNSTGGASDAHTVGAAIKEGSKFSLDAHSTDQTQSGGIDARTSTVSMALTPNKLVGIKAKLDSSLSSASGESGQRTVDFQLTPHAPIKFGANLSEQYAGANGDPTAMLDRKVGTSVALDPSTRLHLGAGYSEDLGTEAQRARSLDASLKPITAIQLSGQYIDRTASASEVPDTAVFSVGLHPSKLLNLNGAYTQTPLDAKGNPIPGIGRSVGVTSRLGLFDLTGKYSLDDPNGPAPPILSRQMSLGLNFGAGARLFGSYESSTQKLSPDGGLYLYSVGFSEKMGDIFNLSLSGQVNTNDTGLDGVRSGLKDNSQAKVGVSARW
ncbi:MAG TPA: hypothetical protein VFJ58_11780 [Armatimonadota bacterium]|nr:hypothetical protein [Armatimonadota bacterium]